MEYRPELYIIYSITALPVCIIHCVFPTNGSEFYEKTKPKNPLSDTSCCLPLGIPK